MAKTATVTALTLAVDPRQRMKEVRARVAQYLKDEFRVSEIHPLDDLLSDKADAVRVVIALQDLLEKQKEKNQKATQHICDMVHMMQDLTDYQAHCHGVIGDMANRLDKVEYAYNVQAQLAGELQKSKRTVEQQRDAVLATLQLTQAGVRT